MGMHVDGLNPLATDHNRQLLPPRWLAVRAMQ